MGSVEENRKLLRKAEKLGDSLSLACFLSSGSARVRFVWLLLTEAPHQALPTLGDGPGAGVCFLSLSVFPMYLELCSLTSGPNHLKGRALSLCHRGYP